MRGDFASVQLRGDWERSVVRSFKMAEKEKVCFNNPKTADMKFLMSRKFEVTILTRKSEGIKGLSNRNFTEMILWVPLTNEKVDIFNFALCLEADNKRVDIL